MTMEALTEEVKPVRVKSPVIPSMKGLSATSVLSRIRELRTAENETIAEIVLLVSEIDRRKLYLAESYSSTFGFLTEGLGYSETSANRRIAVARLVTKHQDIYFKLKSGAFTLAQLADSYTEIISRPEATMKAIEGKSRADSRRILGMRRGHKLKLRLSEAPFPAALMRRVPQMKAWFKSYTSGPGAEHGQVALRYITLLEARCQMLELEIKRIREG